MEFKVLMLDTASEDLESIPKNIGDTITRRIYAMRDGLPGSIKRLRDMDAAFRLRVGDYRILFDVNGDTITVHQVRHRRHAYDFKSGEKKRKGQH